jgi:hypothetical protein
MACAKFPTYSRAALVRSLRVAARFVHPRITWPRRLPAGRRWSAWCRRDRRLPAG